MVGLASSAHPTSWRRWDDGEGDVGGEGGGAVDALDGFDVVGGAGLEDVGDELLGVAVDEGEPGGLDLHHHAVTG